MHRHRLAIFTFLAVFVAIMGVGLLGGRILRRDIQDSYIQLEIEANRLRAEGTAKMIEKYIEAGATHEEAIERFQAAVEGTSNQKGFLCLIDRSGSVLSHPDPAVVGRVQAAVRLDRKGQRTTWGAALRAAEPVVGLLYPGADEPAEVIFAAPIKGTPWFASAHANSAVVAREVEELDRRLTMGAAIIGAIMALAASVTARAVARRYERRIELANRQLEFKVEERTAELRQALEELRIAHGQLVRGEKMNLLGELMSGIAHEIRSPLSSILSGCHIVVAEAKTDGVKKTTGLMREAAERLSSIVNNMLMFARNAPPKRATVGVNDICRRAVDLIASDLKKDGIELRQDLSSDVPRMELDEQQIQQVVLNLLNNARQALNGTDGDRWILLESNADLEAVTLDVRDSGPGIGADQREAVFQPFFTTKDEGTGLGLSLCRRFLEAHGASLDLMESEGGAHFRVVFPRSACETMVVETPSH